MANESSPEVAAARAALDETREAYLNVSAAYIAMKLVRDKAQGAYHEAVDKFHAANQAHFWSEGEQ